VYAIVGCLWRSGGLLTAENYRHESDGALGVDGAAEQREEAAQFGAGRDSVRANIDVMAENEDEKGAGHVAGQCAAVEAYAHEGYHEKSAAVWVERVQRGWTKTESFSECRRSLGTAARIDVILEELAMSWVERSCALPM
jgi:hypothetical protein